MKPISLASLCVLVLLGVSPRGSAQPAGAVPIDRAVVRFHAPDTGGPRRPHFVYRRILAFEARLEALGDPHRGGDPAPFRERHVSSALERHVAETLLAGLRIDPEPTEIEVQRQVKNARSSLLERIGGEASLDAAARAEGIGVRDIHVVLRRQARASLYLDRMVTPMLDPSDAELAALHRTRRTPFRDLPFEVIRPGLRRWYVSQRLAAAVQSFYQNARGRLTLTPLSELPSVGES
jgi:hypothetical protein